MDAATLARAMGGTADYHALVDPMNQAMIAANITTPRRAAMWCAQIGHESVGLRYMEEIASGHAYNGRADLGNVHPGDGPRYKGRGPIQLTGRNNYRAFTRWARAAGHTDIDFEAEPHRLSEPRWGFLAATYYWTVSRPQINAMADAGDLVGVTRAINGGTNGIEDRRARYQRCLALGEALLPTGGKPVTEKMLDYPRDEVHQDTGWNCGPASAQTVIRAAAKKFIPESVLAKEMGTHRGGTDWIGQITRVLNKHLPGGKYATVEMPNDPPSTAQREQMWEHIVSSIDAGYGVVINIVAPPNNYPRPSHTSTTALAYSGGTVYHFVAAMGYAIDANGVRHVWLADSGFKPYGSWITASQLATLCPPKGYAYATAKAPAPAPEPTKENPMTTLDTNVRGYAGGGIEAPLWTFILHADRNSFDAMHAALRCEERMGRIEEKLDRLLAEK